MSGPTLTHKRFKIPFNPLIYLLSGISLLMRVPCYWAFLAFIYSRWPKFLSLIWKCESFLIWSHTLEAIRALLKLFKGFLRTTQKKIFGIKEIRRWNWIVVKNNYVTDKILGEENLGEKKIETWRKIVAWEMPVKCEGYSNEEEDLLHVRCYSQARLIQHLLSFLLDQTNSWMPQYRAPNKFWNTQDTHQSILSMITCLITIVLIYKCETNSETKVEFPYSP